MNTLKIENLKVSVEDKIILNNFNLVVNSNEVHVLMGPNGIGKSTLTKVIMGDPNYKILEGNIYYNDILINDIPVDERSRMGIFLGYQLPLEIEGVSNADFLRSAVSTREKENFKLFEFVNEVNKNLSKLDIDSDMLYRDINQGFSGGERKKNEILQMYILKPSLVMLDEIDSGLDVDSLKIVGEAINNYYKSNDSSLILITHYPRLLDYVKPDFVHVIEEGTIVKTGDYSLVDEIQKNGFTKKSSKKSNITSSCVVKEKYKNE